MIALLRGGPCDGELCEVGGEPTEVFVALPPLELLTWSPTGDDPVVPAAGYRKGVYQRDMLCTDRTAGRFVWVGERG